MNISGIRPSTDFYNYSSISSGYNNLISDDSITIVDRQSEEASASKKANSYVKQEDVSSKQTYDSYDYANEYDSSRTYPMKGSDSDIKNLDVVRAISDLEKDKAISQYHYFVGDSIRGAATTGLEDFSL